MTVVDTLTQYAVQYGLQAAVALGIFIVGIMASRWAGDLAQQALERQTLEPPVRLLLVRVVKIVVMLFTAMIALQTLGVPIAPLIAGVGVAGKRGAECNHQSIAPRSATNRPALRWQER